MESCIIYIYIYSCAMKFSILKSILQSILQISLRLQWFVLFLSPSNLDFNVRNFCNFKHENFYKISIKQNLSEFFSAPY
jgi:hypothetical protein